MIKIVPLIYLILIVSFSVLSIQHTPASNLEIDLLSYRPSVNSSCSSIPQYYFSDQRLKKNIRDYEKALETVSLLKGKQYYWKAEKLTDKSFNKRLQYGFIAQEVEKVLPNLVHQDKNGYKAINYIQIIPILTNSIQGLQRENQQLLDLIQRLEQRVNVLEKL
ncbi:tail fiber domain-containing protein [Aureispira anguillae]|uniref:Tail fiber domain-containing protein n=1 Tax=Aureispira anguillae TaxID=2864201 RepID=A0A916DVX8_9BACT|nr:tail fiber domain-containing protein [Aureispira anguillae]BDS15609.1 tail fiber domain-containing protein [Aureispira anguillae]